jgi:chromosome segregation ATPase
MTDIERLRQHHLDAIDSVKRLHAEVERLSADREKWKTSWLELQTRVNDQDVEIKRAWEVNAGLKALIVQFNEVERKLLTRVHTLEGMLGEANIAVPE